MLIKEQGIVLSTVRHNDTASIMRVFTKTRGMAAFVFHLGKSHKSVAHNALQQPLTEIEFQTDYMPSASLFHLKDVHNTRPNCSIAASPEKSAIALLLSEFLTHALKGEQCNPKLYSFLTGSMEWFDTVPGNRCANFHIALMLGVASCLGISPDTGTYRQGMVLDLREGCFTGQPAHSDFASARESMVIARLLELSLSEAGDAPLTGGQRVMLLKTLNRYYRLHLPDFPELESIDILQAVFC